jgi:hypothetical protein
MLKALPGWVVDNESSLAREAEPYVDLTPEERAVCLVEVCRTAMSIARNRPDSAKVLAFRDQLPASTERALASLREREQARVHSLLARTAT